MLARADRVKMKVFIISLVVSALLFGLCSSSDAQSAKIYRIGYLSSGISPSATDPVLAAFRQGLRKLGYVDRHNVIIESRYAELDQTRLAELANELAQLKVDVILTSPDEPVIHAVQLATRAIPVVMSGSVVDPLAATFWGEKQRRPLVVSLAKPDGNFTGLTNLDSELHGKRLELIKEAFPRVSRVALVWPRAQQQKQTLKDIEVVSRGLGIEIQSLPAGTLDDLDRALSEINRKPPDALLVARSQVIMTHKERIIGVATKKRLPTIFPEREFVDVGGLMSYGADTRNLYQRAATYVDKILKGANPGELPIERPRKFDFVINLKTAKQIGLTIPPNVLARADRVIR